MHILHVAVPLRAHAIGMSIAPLRDPIRTRSDSFERRLRESALVLHFLFHFCFSRYRSMLHFLLVQVHTKSKFRTSLWLALMISPFSIRALPRDMEPETHPSPGIGLGVGCGAGIGLGVGEATGLGVGCGAGIGTGVGVGCGVGIGTGVGMEVTGVGVGEADGVGMGCGAGIGTGEVVVGSFRTDEDEVALFITAKSSDSP